MEGLHHTSDSRVEKVSHGPLWEIPTSSIRPSPENDRLYRPVDPNDPDIIALAESMASQGVLEPLVLTVDWFIVSGHRRFVAAKLARLETVPCRVLSIRRADDVDEFVRLLREFNRQREKTRAERLREEIVTADPYEAYQSLIEHREESARVITQPFNIVGTKERKRISHAKQLFLAAIEGIVSKYRKYWPLTARQVHYWLLNDPPLKHAGKPDSRYANNQKSYKSLIELLVRARLAGHVPMEAIGDETRPVNTWRVWPTSGAFVRGEIDGFLKNYWRDLMQSQENHVEIVGEKNTVAPIISPVAAKYCIPLTTGRGYSSLPPRYAMAQRFKASGKGKLVLIVVSDFDPEGEDIAHSFAQSMRDDFGIASIHPIKAALTADQVQSLDLPENTLEAKASSSRYKAFVTKHGTKVWELESLHPEQLKQMLHDAIDSVIDREAFNLELNAEQQDSAFLAGVRRTVAGLMETCFDDDCS